MSNIIQNMKSGFANMKELFGIMLSDDTNEDNYDLYINGQDTALAQTAQELKDIEEEQEKKRLSLFGIKIGIEPKKRGRPRKVTTNIVDDEDK